MLFNQAFQIKCKYFLIDKTYLVFISPVDKNMEKYIANHAQSSVLNKYAFITPDGTVALKSHTATFYDRRATDLQLDIFILTLGTSSMPETLQEGVGIS